MIIAIVDVSDGYVTRKAKGKHAVTHRAAVIPENVLFVFLGLSDFQRPLSPVLGVT
jgi:hypothetical protein